MKNIIYIVLIASITVNIIYAQDNNTYSNAIFPQLPDAYDFFIAREGNNKLPQYIHRAKRFS